MAIVKSDPGYLEVEQVLTDIEAKMHWQYVKAADEMKAKFEKYMKQFKKDDELQRERLLNGELTQGDYIKWRERKLLVGEHWAQQLETLAVDAVNTDKIAMSIVKGHMPEAYAIERTRSYFLTLHRQEKRRHCSKNAKTLYGTKITYRQR